VASSNKKVRKARALFNRARRHNKKEQEIVPFSILTVSNVHVVSYQKLNKKD